MFFRIFLLFIFCFSLTKADILKPAYLEVIQKNKSTYSVLLKLSAEEGKKPLLRVRTIKGCKEEKSRLVGFVNGSYMERYDLVCDDKLKGKIISLEGLENKKIDLLLRLEFLDKSSQSVLLDASNTSYGIKKDASSLQIIQTYTWLGVTHILMGFDHLLFVFLLLLIVKNTRLLLWTISAFTLAHSLTIAGATLGLVSLPQEPVEAIIALSILFLALEIVYAKRGQVGLTMRYPWLVAFIFGLLHGFGFAGALAEIGLPHQAITLALIFFNVGVEIGQLIFVAIVLFMALPLRYFVSSKFMQKIEIMLVYVIGGLASFWLIERILAFP